MSATPAIAGTHDFEITFCLFLGNLNRRSQDEPEPEKDCAYGAIFTKSKSRK
jgi:hypothetical protein